MSLASIDTPFGLRPIHSSQVHHLKMGQDGGMKLLDQDQHSSHNLSNLSISKPTRSLQTEGPNARMGVKERKEMSGSINAQGTREQSPWVGCLVAALTMETHKRIDTIVLNMVGTRGVMVWWKRGCDD